MSLNNDDVLKILALLDASDFEELRLETGEYKLHVRRTGALPADRPEAAPPAASAPSVQPVPSLQPAAVPQSASQVPPPFSEPLSPAAAPAAQLVDVITPLLGTFYRSPQPGAPPFVEAGAAVIADTVVGIVEVMKLMSSVSAGVAGVVAEILVSDGQLVEYGDILMRIRPDGV